MLQEFSKNIFLATSNESFCIVAIEYPDPSTNGFGPQIVCMF